MHPTARVPAFQPSTTQFLFPEPPASDPAPEELSPSHSLRIKLKPMSYEFRSSTRQNTASAASGSEYHESVHSPDEDDNEAVKEEPTEDEPKKEMTTSARGRRTNRVSYVESESEDEMLLRDGPSRDLKGGGRFAGEWVRRRG